MNHTIQILLAARAYLRLDQKEVAELSSLDKQTISQIEREKNAPSATTLRKLRQVYEDRGIVFTQKGLEFEPYKVSTMESFMDVLDDAEQVLRKGDELLLHCADERRNSVEVTAKFKALRNKGIRIRMTCEEGNLTVTGKPEDYRWIDTELYSNSQVEVIYADKFFFHLRDDGRDYFVMTKNKEKARSAKRQFEYQLKKGKTWETVRQTKQ